MLVSQILKDKSIQETLRVAPGTTVGSLPPALVWFGLCVALPSEKARIIITAAGLVVLAVIDNLTAGRTGLGIASGWQPDDFILRPAQFGGGHHFHGAEFSGQQQSENPAHRAELPGERQLADQSRMMEDLVVARTAALHAAHDPVDALGNRQALQASIDAALTAAARVARRVA